MTFRSSAKPLELNVPFTLAICGGYPKKRFMIEEDGKLYSVAGTNMGYTDLDKSFNASISFYLMMKNPVSKVALKLSDVQSVHFEKALGRKTPDKRIITENNMVWIFNSIITLEDNVFYMKFPLAIATLENITY